MINLEELGRMANVGGDIAYKNWLRGKGKRAEDFLSRFTSGASSEVEGGYEGEKWLNAAKFFSMFGGGVGKAINIGLSGVDMALEAKHAKNIKDKYRQKLKDIPDSPFKKYLEQNMNAVLSQVEQSTDESLKASLINNMTNIGLKALPMDKLSGPMQETVQKLFPMEQIRPFSTDYLPEFGPSVRDITSLGEPYLRSLMRGKSRPTSPAGPAYRAPSLRRRIV